GSGVDGRGGKGETGADAMPGPPDGPGGGWPRVSPACPVAEVDPGERGKPFVDGVAHADAGVVGPSPHEGVARAEQLPLRPGLPALAAPSKRGELVRPLACGGVAQGVAPETPRASRALARWGWGDPPRPEGKSPLRTP